MRAAPIALPFSGERYTPETAGEIAYEHWHRYCIAQTLARGKRVLDAACGEGYGSALLAETAAEVIGVDLSATTLAHARERYGNRPRLRFLQESVTALSLPDASVDLIVSFETIEHLAEQAAMLAEFRRVLAPEGSLFISSPNRPVYSDERGYHNTFHVRELDRAELAALLASGFPQQRWYGQRLLFHSLIWPEARPATSIEVLAHDGEHALPTNAPAPPMYFLVLCGGERASLPELDRISLFADRDLSIYREFERTTRAERKLYPLYQESERALGETRGQLDAAREAQMRLQERVAQLQVHADTQAGAIRTQAQHLAELQRTLTLRQDKISQLENDLVQRRDEVKQFEIRLAQQRLELQEVQARLAYRETLAGWLRAPLSRLRRAFGGAR